VALIRTVAIAGVGLMGGSFALAIRKAGFNGEILGVSSPRSIEQGLALGAIDRGATLEDAAAQADLVYLAQPISRILEQIPVVARCISPHTLVTDVGSTKAKIVACANEHMSTGIFLGGHPMAGKESRGVEAACADLFNSRTYILTPSNDQEIEHPVIAEFLELIKSVRSNTLFMKPEMHDNILAFTSHLAQMASTALSATVLDSVSNPAHLKTAGPGLHDMSRLAMSSFDVWKDILATNHEAIDRALAIYIDSLQSIRSGLREPAAERLFEKGAILARSIRTRPQ
jgi:prephenate dehydrogenase